MKLNHLCFADDLLMFCTGDPTTIQNMLHGFKPFSDTTGLKVNKSKLAVYHCGMRDEEVKAIQGISGLILEISLFSILALGVPINAKKTQGLRV